MGPRWIGGSLMAQGEFTYNHHTPFHDVQDNVNVATGGDMVQDSFSVIQCCKLFSITKPFYTKLRPLLLPAEELDPCCDVVSAELISCCDVAPRELDHCCDVAPLDHVWDELGGTMLRRNQLHPRASLQPSSAASTASVDCVKFLTFQSDF